jgi:hypothetical protein
MLRQILSEEQQHARVKNAVARFLFGILIVPKIFFDAQWPSKRNKVDVLAVDRAGAGEIHVAEVKIGTGGFGEALCEIGDIPAHFKYLALFENAGYIPSDDGLYAPDGMGRIGVIQVRESGTSDLSVDFLIRPERFRLNPTYFRQIDKFTTNRLADIEIRP